MRAISRKCLVALTGLTLALSVPPLTASATPSPSAPVSRAAAVPGLAPASSTSKAVYLDAGGRDISEPGGLPRSVLGARSSSESSATARLGCTPQTNVDNPHYSSGDVSAHGSWNKGTCTASTAHVVNCLYEWYTDSTWRQKACSVRKQLRPYTGSGERTIARATCSPTAGLVSWRNHVNVDVDGQIDTSEVPYKQAAVNCYVY